MDTSDASEKKSGVDSLDRDELIKRCKKLLGIAQNAKKAKTDLTNEIAILNEKLQSCDTQKQADKDCLKTMQLMIDSLTENKLASANRLADLEKCINNLNEQNAKKTAELNKLTQLQIENEAQQKQINRLTRENEEQESDLHSLDERFAKVSELSQRQTQELLVLERSVDRWKEMEAEYHRLQDECKTLREKCEMTEITEPAASNVEYEQTIKKLEEARDNNRRMYEEVEKQFNQLQADHEDLRQTNVSSDVEDKIDVMKEQLQHENQQLKKKYDEKSAKLNKYKSKVIEFSYDLKEMKKANKILHNTVLDYSNSVGGWQKQIADAANSLIVELDKLNKSKIELEKEIQAKCTKCDDLRETIDGLQQLSDSQASKASAAKDEYEKLLHDYELLETEVQNKNTEIQSLSTEWEQICSELKQKDTENSTEIKTLTQRFDEKATAFNELQTKFDAAENRNEELLVEMRELNDALKARGNAISNQANEMNQMKCKLQEQNDQLNGLQMIVTEKTEQLQQLQNQYNSQTIEMTQLDENLKDKNRQFEQLRIQYDNYNNQSDILSTSTISRADEINRMRDIEDSFEEKYNKLRALAVRLKKKVVEQQAIITKHESTPVETMPAVNMQNLKSLQAENDRLLDKIDNMTIEQKKLKSDIVAISDEKRKVDVEFKSLQIVTEDIKATAENNHKVKSALNEQIRTNETQLEEIKIENRSVTKQLKNAEGEIEKVKDTVKLKDAEIQQKLDEIAKLKGDIGKMQSSMKKHSVLNLEVEAYEKSLQEMSTKLESSTKQLTDAKNENRQLDQSMQPLNTEIQTLQNQLELEKQNSNELQQQNDLQQIKLKEYNGEIIELKRIIDDHTKDSNKMKIELTNLQSQQSENEIERQQFISKLKKDNEKSISQQFALEDEVRELKAKLNDCEQELANVQTEFASYKVRAQTVLRKNQSRDACDEEELREELALIKQTKEELTTKLNNSNEHQKRLTHTIDELTGEKQNLQDRCKKLLLVMEETRQQFETVQNDNRKQAKEYQETLKTHRLQIDTLNNCFKKQIEDMEKKHSDEMSDIKSTYSGKKADTAETTQVAQAKTTIHPELQRIEMIMSERQAGEGSESTISSAQMRKMSTSSRNKHDLVPLDELLNSSYEDEANDTERHSEKFVGIDKLQAEQSRVNHLSTLLSEAEMDVTRLTEMNKMLKEEMRRQDRSEEREKHMHNLEYMKNIIFKFLTIGNGDERTHLLPVLNIILKLSPEENRQLESIARGGDGGQSGWRLPMW